VKFRIRMAFATVTNRLGSTVRDSDKRGRFRRNLYSVINDVHAISPQSEEYPMKSMEIPLACEILDAGTCSPTGTGVRNLQQQHSAILRRTHADPVDSKIVVSPENSSSVVRVRLADAGEPDGSVSYSLTPELLDSQTTFKMMCEDARDAFSLCSFSLMSMYRDVSCHSIFRSLSNLVPVTRWLPDYTLSKFALDLQSGVVVGCMLVPQSMGYAGVACLPVERGLYASLFPLMVYSIFGTSRQMGVGPVAIISLLLAQGLPACPMVCRDSEGHIESDSYPKCKNTCPDGQVLVFNERYARLASTTAIVSGLAQVIFAPILGFIMNFVPHPVIIGFTSGGGLIIAMSQLESVVGFSIRKDRLQDGVFDLLVRMKEINRLSCGMGVLAILLLLLIREIAAGKLRFTRRGSTWISKVAKLPWALALVGIYTAVTSAYDLGGSYYGVQIVGFVPAGLPSISLPFLSSDLTPRVIFLTVQIVIIGYLESIAVETKYGSIFKYQIRPTQEAVALGFANLVSGLTGGYPITGGFSRSATNATYGSQTPMCNLITSLIIMFSLLFLTNLFQHMPKNILAAIVIVAALSLLDPREAIFLWRSSKKEWFLMVFTFLLTGFFALELGILISVSLCVAEVLYKSTRPKVALISDRALVVYLPGAGKYWKEETNIQSLEIDIRNLQAAASDFEILYCRVEGDLTFASAARLKKIIGKKFFGLCEAKISCKFIFDLCEMDIMDTTALDALMALVEEVEARLAAVLIIGVPPTLHKFLKIDIVQKRLANVTFFECTDDVVKDLHSFLPDAENRCRSPAEAAERDVEAAERDVEVEVRVSGAKSPLQGRARQTTAAWGAWEPRGGRRSGRSPLPV
jgi:sulfate permease, SulP family